MRKIGYKVTDICTVLGINRSTYYKKSKKVLLEKSESEIAKDLVAHIYDIINDSRYTGYGYRRVWAVLKYDRKINVSKNKVQRIMQLKGWQAKPVKRPKRYGGKPYEKPHNVVPKRRKVSVEEPDTRWSTDLTKFYVEECGWVNLIPVLDCCTRECIGYRVSYRGRAIEACEALDEAVMNRFGKVGPIPVELSLRMDNGSIFLANKYWKELKFLGIQPEYTPYRYPKANGIVERFMKTIKEECIWQYKFKTFEEAELVISKWIEFYNKERRHSSLNYLSPFSFRESLRKLAA